MSSPKLRKRLLAGILCAGMIFQSVPMNVSAYEDKEIVESEEAVEETAPAETKAVQEEKTRTETVDAEEGENQKAATAELYETDNREVEEIKTEEPPKEESKTEEFKTEETETDAFFEELKEAESEAVDVDMEYEFPDEVFRTEVYHLLKKTPSEIVYEEDLATIKEFVLPRNRDNQSTQAPIRSIRGIRYLTGLTKLDLSYHEISDVSSTDIDWKSLSNLESVNLDGNDIVDAPNFYQNNKLKDVSLKENLLSEDSIKWFLEKGVPNRNVTLADDTIFSQRTGRFRDKVHVESNYYICGESSVPFTIMVGGYKSKLEYTITFKIDGEDVFPTHKTIDGKEYENIYWIEDAGLEEGTHEISVSLLQDGSDSDVTKEFQVVRQDCYPKKLEYQYYYSINSEDDIIDLYYRYYGPSTARRIEQLSLVDRNGKEYIYRDISFKYSVETKDYRYTDIEGNAGIYIKENYMHHAAFSMEDIIYALPTGVYTLNVFIEGDVHYQLENLIRIRSNVVDPWKYELSRGGEDDPLYYNDSERNTATLSVTGTDKTVKFEIEEFEGEAVTLEPSEDDPNKVIITAGNGVGSAVIKMTIGDSIRDSIQRTKVIVYERTYAESLLISTTAISMEGIGKTGEIDVTVSPQEALEFREELEVTVSNPDVFVIDRQVQTENGIRITVKSVGGGIGTLTVKVKDSEVPSVSCNITVTEGSFTELEKQKLLERVGTIYCITNVDGTRLGDLPLPEGWEWIEPDTTVAVLSDAPGEVQRYTAKYSRESYTSFNMPLPVAVTQITGITVSGPTELTTGHIGDFSASLSYRGYHVESNKSFVAAVDKAVSFDWSADRLFRITEKNGRNAKIRAGSVSEVTVGIVSASVKVGEDVFTDNYDVVVLTEYITSISLTPDDDWQYKNRNKQAIYPYRYNEIENVVYVNEADITPSKNRMKFQIEASTDDRTVEVKKGTFTWSINDSKLGEIKEAEDGTVQLYVYGSGTIILRATANDIGEPYARYAEVVLEVRDYSPILETNNIVVNKYAVDGSEIPVYAIEGNDIVSIPVENQNFEAVKVDGRWRLRVKKDYADLYQKKTTVKTKISIKTQMGNTLERDVNIVVDTTRPKVKFVQKTAPNLFYTDTIAQYAVNTDYDIIGITQDGERDKGFNLVSYDSNTGILTIKADGLDKSTRNEFKNKNSEYCTLSLLIKYEEYGTQKESIKITSKIKKPSLKIQEVALTGPGQDANTYLIDSKTKKKLPLSATSAISSLTDTVTAEKTTDGEGIALAYTGEKSKSYKLLVSDSKWTEDLKISGKISMVKSLTTQLDQKSITLNMAHNIRKNGTVPIAVSVKNSTARVIDVKCEAANDKAAQLIDDSNGTPYLAVSYDILGRTLQLGLNDGNMPSGLKAGSYKFNISAVIAGTGEESITLSPAALSISLVDASKGPKVKLSGKGKINLIDRENTSIIYTPKVTNMTSSIKSVKITGENRALFNARLTEDAKIEVKAIKGTLINVSNYDVGLELTFENKVSLLTNVKIKPVNKTPKLQAGKKDAVIYRDVNNDVRWKLYNRGGFGKITNVTLTDSVANEKFTITMSENNQITLKLAEATKRTIPKGKYTVTYQVHFSDMALDAKPVTMKMKVVVK